MTITSEIVVFFLVLATAIAGIFTSVQNRISAVRDELHKTKVEVAAHYATIQSLARVEERFTVMGDKLISRIDLMSQALNRLIGRLEQSTPGEESKQLHLLLKE